MNSEDTGNMEKDRKVKLCKAFKLSKDDTEFTVFHYRHCTVLSPMYKSKNFKGIDAVCAECGATIPLYSIICFNTPKTYDYRKYWCKQCWDKKYLDVD